MTAAARAGILPEGCESSLVRTIARSADGQFLGTVQVDPDGRVAARRATTRGGSGREDAAFGSEAEAVLRVCADPHLGVPAEPRLVARPNRSETWLLERLPDGSSIRCHAEERLSPTRLRTEDARGRALLVAALRQPGPDEEPEWTKPPADGPEPWELSDAEDVAETSSREEVVTRLRAAWLGAAPGAIALLAHRRHVLARAAGTPGILDLRARGASLDEDLQARCALVDLADPAGDGSGGGGDASGDDETAGGDGA